MSDAYDYGDPKNPASYREPATCALCSCVGGHDSDCVEVQR